ncbi:MAG: triose-phosphate isomerase [Deltaproteobacteria bacterium]|nr:triose-phosphate isomerase [Deltaproteobacteria bacterium]
MRRPWIGGNWKMHKTIGEALELARALKAGLPAADSVEVVVAPPYTALKVVADELRGAAVQLAAQNIHWADQGAYTGEISPVMVRDTGCRQVIIGHSERRQWFGETDELINKKIGACLNHDLEPVFCVGETLEEREAGRVEEVLTRQVREGLRGFNRGEAARGVIAYEPVWAIGTGKTATPETAQQVHSFIRDLLAGLYDKTVASAKRIVYGGSMTPETARGLITQPDIDGGLIGGASLKAESFLAIVKECI